ncbi:hypothetical protein KY338_04600 [Candidatus Woesearchaeota archaeon]|nr:hypothetical protein [Candidatus Woesearchaeota archaeon]MBW3005741.1 hypothetical protein [Candidatus Woesearchaeota archaeon]
MRFAIPLVLILCLILIGCETSGQAYQMPAKEQEIYQLQSAKICCAVKNLRGEFVYTVAENDAACTNLRGMVTNCPRVCCNVNGQIFGEYSINFCLIREGVPVQCPALRW